MPNYYAHLKFGAQVLKQLPETLALRVGAEREAFDLGCLGPDPLFFYRAGTPTNAVRREGFAAHHTSAYLAGERLRTAVEENLPMSRGYAAGFFCHLGLDSICHSYINSKAAEGEILHQAMEMEYDRMLMDGDGLSPLHQAYLPVLPGTATCVAACRAYPRLTPHQYWASYSSMVRIIRLLHLAYGTRAVRVSERLSRFRPLYKLRGLIIDREPAPASAETNEALAAMMASAVTPTAEQVSGFFAAIAQDRPLSDWFHRDFNGHVFEDLPYRAASY